MAAVLTGMSQAKQEGPRQTQGRAARGSDTGNMFSAARSKNGLRDFGPGGDNRPIFEP